MSDDEVQKLENELREVLTCNICRDTFDDPRSLPCQHAFCVQCIRSDIKQRTKTGAYNCPNCRDDVRLPKGGADGLPSNFYLKNLVDIITKDKGRKCEGHNKSVTGYCSKCDKTVCDECVTEKCSTHKYNVCDIEKAIVLAKGVIKKLSVDIKERAKILNAKIKDSDSNYKLTSNAFDKYKKSVQSTVEDIVFTIKVEERRYLQEVETKFTLVKSEIDAFKEATTKRVSSMNRFAIESGTFMNTTNLGDLLDFKHRIQDAPDVKTFEVVDAPLPFTSTFQPNVVLKDSVRELCTSLGEVSPFCIASFSTLRGAMDGGSGVTAVVVTKDDDVICVDDCGVRMFDIKGDMLLEFQHITYPFSCVESGNGSVYVGEKNGRISLIKPDGSVKDVSDVKGGLMGLAVNARNNFVVTSESPPCVQVVSPQGITLVSVNENKRGDAMFADPWHVVINSRNQMLVSDWMENTVTILSEHGEELARYEPRNKNEELYCPRGLCCDANDNIYICDQYNNRVIKLTPGGEFLKVVLGESDKLDCPISVAFDHHGNIVVGEGGDMVKIFKLKL